MAQYLLAVYMVAGEPVPNSAELAQMYKDVDMVNTELSEAGALVFAGGLQPAQQAIVVRATEREVVTTRGPFTAYQEQLGGFWVIEAPDLDAAVNWARKATQACRAPVEVRPFEAEPEPPGPAAQAAAAA